MATRDKKRHVLIGLSAAFALLFASIAGLAGAASGQHVLTASATEGATINVPAADYEFTITKNGMLYSAACNKALTVAANNTLTNLIAAIDTAAGAGKVKKLIFDGGTNGGSGESLPLDVGSETCYLRSGTYILDGMIAGTSSDGIIWLDNNASLYIESAEIYATRRAILSNSSGAINITGGTISATNETAIFNISSGAINIAGGMISSTSSYAIYTASVFTGDITISQAAGAATLVTSGCTDSTIQLHSSTRLMVTGGTVQNTSSGYVIRNGEAGSIEISGGTVQNTSTGIAIINVSTGVITVNGTALVTSKNTNSYSGTVHLINAGGTLCYVEGLITNTAGGNVIYNPYNATVIKQSKDLLELISLMNAADTCKDFDQATYLRGLYDALSEEDQLVFDNTFCAENEDCLMGEKLAYMEYLAGFAGQTAKSNILSNLIADTRTNLASILVIGLLGLSAASGYYVFQKKKNSENQN